MNRAANAYFQTQTATTSQGELLILLYDGAIKFLTRAKEKITERDFAAKGIAISKAIDIISELDASLNAEKGGTLAENLHRLYMFCNTRLLDANLKMNTAFVDDVINILGNLRSAYASVINTPEAQNAAKMAPPIASTTRVSTRIPQPTVFGRPIKQPHAAPTAAPMRPQQAVSAYKRDAELPIESFPHTTQSTPAPVFAPTASGSGMPIAAQNIPQSPGSLSAPGTPAQENRPAGTQDPSKATQPTGGFSRALAGSSLYRKMARQI